MALIQEQIGIKWDEMGIYPFILAIAYIYIYLSLSLSYGMLESIIITGLS